MDDSLVIKILECLNSKKDLYKLVKEGYTFQQVNSGIIKAKEEGFLKTYYRKLAITEKGILQLNKKKEFVKIEPLNSHKIKRMSLEQIYIPSNIKGVIERWRTS